MQLGKGKLAGTIDGHEQIEAAFFRWHFGYVDMDITKRIFLKLFLGRFVAFHLWQVADAMALEATM